MSLVKLQSRFLIRYDPHPNLFLDYSMEENNISVFTCSVGVYFLWPKSYAFNLSENKFPNQALSSVFTFTIG